MSHTIKILGALSAFFLTTLVAFAEPGDSAIDELRFGASSINPGIGPKQSYYDYDQVGLNVEVLLAPFDFDGREIQEEGIIRDILTPRFHFGGLLSLDDNTANSVYLGLTWHHALVGPVFLETSFGAALHDGALKTRTLRPGVAQRGLGSNLLFRESIALGVEITEAVNLILQVSHMSHAGLAGRHNVGQTDLALKLGIEF